MSESIFVTSELIIRKIRPEIVEKIPIEFIHGIINLLKAEDLDLINDIHHIHFRRLVLLKFIEVEYKIFIPISTYVLSPQTPNEIKANILNHVTFIQHTLKLLKILDYDYKLNPYEYIAELIKERFIFINQFTSYCPENSEHFFSTVTNFKKRLQRENNELFFPSYKNIYNSEREFYSWYFIQMCLNEVYNNKYSFSGEYSRLGTLRKKLVSHLIKSKGCIDIRNGTVHKEYRGSS